MDRPDYIVGFEPGNLMTTEVKWENRETDPPDCTEMSSKPSVITWRDQLRDPIFQFVVLVAGFSRKPVSDFVQDDSKKGASSLQEENILKSLKATLTKLKQTQKEALIFASLSLTRILNHNVTDRWGQVVRHKVDSLKKLIDKVRASEIKSLDTVKMEGDYVSIENYCKRQQQDLPFIESDINQIESKIKEVVDKGSKAPFSTLGQNPGALMQVVDDHAAAGAIHFSNEMFFKPEFQSALLVTYEKIRARCGDIKQWKGKPFLNQLMTNNDLKTCFARLVAFNVLIIHENNPRGEWKGIINYRRIVKQENVTINRLKNLLGVRTRSECHVPPLGGSVLSTLDFF